MVNFSTLRAAAVVKLSNIISIINSFVLQVVELVPDGANIPVTADNKIEYIFRMADFKLNKEIARQCDAFRKGSYDTIVFLCVLLW